MTVNTGSPDAIVVLDREELSKGLITAFAAVSQTHSQIVSNTGAGFARGVTFTRSDQAYHVLCLGEHNSQPFTYLTLGAFATQHNISSVIALTGAHSLREDLLPGDLAIVRRASALPYPALYENRDPYEPAPTAEHYDARPDVIENYTRLIADKYGKHLWQRDIPLVTCGFAKHPTWAGELMPWAPEQFQKLKDQGAETLSSVAAGVYEAQSLMPEAEIICINQVRSNPNSDSSEQWKRYKNRFHSQTVSLLLSLITAGPISTR